MKHEVKSYSWPLLRLGEAIELLARESGFSPRSIEFPPIDFPATDHSKLEKWISDAGECLGIETEPADTPYPEFESFIRDSGPAILQLPGDEEPRFLALLGRRGRSVLILAPDRSRSKLAPEAIRASMCAPLEAPRIAKLDRMLEEVDVPLRSRNRARTALLCQQLGSTRISGCWLVRPSPGSSFWGQLRRDGHPRRLLGLLTAHVIQYALWIFSWWLVGVGALQGRIDRGWLLAWVLVLMTLIPFRLFVTWSQGLLAIGVGGLLKKRLLHGVLRLPQDEIRHKGSGQLLGSVIEAEAVESLALSGGFMAVIAVIELIAAGVVLALGAGGWIHLVLLLAWTGLTLLFCYRFLQRRRVWTTSRLSMTHDLVESMVGHRTRVVQQIPTRWHDGEDQALEQYLNLSSDLDRSDAMLIAVVPRGWLVVGLLGLALAFGTDTASTGALAVAIGGMLLAYRAFERLAAGASHLAGAAIAWDRVAPLFRAGGNVEKTGSLQVVPPVAADARESADAKVVLDVHELSFRYHDRGNAVLDRCSLKVRARDRVLLEGPSGCGKSTLASILVGLREPESGLLLLHGLDRQTMGPVAWRRRIVAAPQFHENHILTGTLAFNLLMSRRWPPREEDYADAESICVELGLGDLLQRMPAGLLQMVGESGWQLSQGERSRVYIARALLQGADLVVLDESFAALDPETLNGALRCVLNRAPALVVIAHP